jgi:hypothetical protein
MWFCLSGEDNTERGCIESERPQKAGRGEWGRPWGSCRWRNRHKPDVGLRSAATINTASLTPTGDEAREDERGYSADTNGTVNATHVNSSSSYECKCALSAATRTGAGRLNPYPLQLTFTVHYAEPPVAVAHGARLVNGRVCQLQSLCSHLARFSIGRHLCQLQAMGGVADVALSVVDRSLSHPSSHDRTSMRPRNLRPASFTISRMSQDFSSIPSSDIT